MKNYSIKNSKSNKTFFNNCTRFFGWKFENLLNMFAREFTEYSENKYTGGYWEAGYIGEAKITTYFPIVPNDNGETFEVCNPQNYFEGTITNRAFGIAVYLMALSQTSFSGGNIGQNATQIYHQFRTAVLDSGESADKDSLTKEEIKSIFGLIN